VRVVTPDEVDSANALLPAREHFWLLSLLVLRALAWLGLPKAVGDDCRDSLPRRVSPADAKRMPGRVRVHLVTLVGIEIRSWLEQPGAEGHRLLVRGSRVVEVEVEMHLLRGSVRPVGRNMVRRQLHADPPLSARRRAWPP
jgi:hypothetical protein